MDSKSIIPIGLILPRIASMLKFQAALPPTIVYLVKIINVKIERYENRATHIALKNGQFAKYVFKECIFYHYLTSAFCVPFSSLSKAETLNPPGKSNEFWNK